MLALVASFECIEAVGRRGGRSASAGTDIERRGAPYWRRSRVLMPL